MAYDYAEDIAFAQEVIAEFGRPCTFEIVTSTPADTSKPWNGPAAPVAASSSAVPAAFVPVSGAGLGKQVEEDMLLHRAQQVCLVAPSAAEPSFDFAACHRVQDGGVSWRVVKAEVFRPGGSALLYALGLAR